MTMAFHAGCFAAGAAAIIAPPAPLALYVAPDGTGSGANWADAAPITALNALIPQALASGAEIWLRADGGTYPDVTVSLTNGGAAGHPVVIRGKNLDGSDGFARFVGIRADPYVPGEEAGNSAGLLTLNAGADHLTFKFLRFERCGFGCIRIRQPVSDLTIADIEARNCRAVILNQAGGVPSATISGFTFERIDARGFSKRAIYVRYDSHDGLIRDCWLDSQAQDKDSFAGGCVFNDTAHDITVEDVTALNCYESKGPTNYWNADGFSDEGGNYNITYRRCTAKHCTDGGFDLKSTNAQLIECHVEDCKRNYRFWGDATLYQCTGLNPFKRGGSGDVYQVGAYFRAFVRIIECEFSRPSGISFKIENTAVIATDAYTRSHTTPGGTQHQIAGSNGQYALLNVNDATAPTVTGSLAFSLPEGKVGTFQPTTSEACVVELMPGGDLAQFSVNGRVITMKKQDYENPLHPDNQLHLFFRLRDVNNNRSVTYEAVVSVTDVADSPIDPAETFDYDDSDGFWVPVRPEQCFADIYGFVPAATGDPVLRVEDISGKGRHWLQPEENRGAILQSDGAEVFWLDFDGFDDFYEVGDVGDLRFAQATLFMVIRRTDEGDGTAADESSQLLYSYPRSTSKVSYNSQFSIGVLGGNDAFIRVGGTNTTASDGAAPASRPIVLSLRSTDARLQSDKVEYANGPDVAAIGYGQVYRKARIGCDGNPTPGSFFSGRVYGGVLLNQAANDDIISRVEGQLIQLAGRSFA